MESIEKFTHQNSTHTEAMNRLPFSYFSLPMYLDEHAYVWNRNGETLLACKNPDATNKHAFQILFPPKNPKNLEDVSMLFATQADLDEIEKHVEILYTEPTVREFFYRTDAFIHPTGSLAKKIRAFASHHVPTILHTYPKEAIVKFYETWKQQRERNADTMQESEQSFFDLLNRLEEFGIKQVYVEIDGKLVGLAWGIKHPSGHWVGLHLKALYEYRDLGRFLHHERAKLFEGCELFTIGTDMFDKGVEQYKRELHPIEERQYHFVLTGNALGKGVKS